MSLTPTEDRTISKLKKMSISTLISKNQRLDGRRLDEYRSIEVKLRYIPKAEGSAYVKLGGTVVVAGVKIGVGTPFPDTPNCGVLTVNAEFVPLASPSFEPGPPDENAIELARVIDRSLREVRAVDLEKLAIVPGKHVYILWLDIYILDHDGNLLDPSMLAAMAALMSTRLPKAIVQEDGGVELDFNETSKLPLNHKVVTVTVGKINNTLLIDPDIDEEKVLEAKIAVSFDETGRIVGMQKMGHSTFSEELVLKAIALAREKSKELLNILDNLKVEE